MSVPVDSSAYTKDNPFPAKLVENRLLNRSGSAKETRHFAVDLEGSGLQYEAGDSLGVFPSNRPAEVQDLLLRLGATGDEPVLLPKATASISLREGLTTRLALAGPTKKILDTMFSKVTHSAEKAQLAELLAPESKEQMQMYLDEREFADLLGEYPSAKFSPQEFVEHLRRLMPRLYSIASSPKWFPRQIHLTVAVVRYQANGRDRVGVCSTFLADRVDLNDTPVPVFVSHSHFGPPEDGTKDIIMVGPGTGIAPFRAFVQERIASTVTGRNWVFFGDQRKATDYLYGEEWDEFVAKGQVARLDLAWSRDQPQKVYVQDKMRERAAELWAWIKSGAYFYVCGDAKRMAKDVDAALHEIIAQQGGMEAVAAMDYVKLMKKEKRYQRDVY